MSDQNVRVPVKNLVDFMITALLKMGIPRLDSPLILAIRYGPATAKRSATCMLQ